MINGERINWIHEKGQHIEQEDLALPFLKENSLLYMHLESSKILKKKGPYFHVLLSDFFILFTQLNRLHILELGVGAYLLFCGWYNLLFGKNHFFIYLFFQAFAFFVAGFGYVGTFVPGS